MGSIMRRGKKLYLRYVEGYRAAVNPDGTPKLWESGENKGQPKVNAEGRPLMEAIERTRLARGATTVAEARPMLAEIERRIMRGELGVPEPTAEEQGRKTITVADLFGRFNKEYTSPKIKVIADYRAEALSNYTVRIDPVLGKRAAATVETTDVEKLRDQLTADGYAGNSVVLTLALVSKMFTWGKKAKVIDCDNPARGCDRPAVHQSIDYLEKEEVAALLAYAAEHTPDLHPMIATAIYTGCRKGELLGLRWRDVHTDTLKIDVMRSYDTLPKSGKVRHLPMHPTLAPILREWKKRCPKTDAALVFPVDGAMGKNDDMLGIAEVLELAGCHLPAKPWHSMRDTFASHFIMAGGNVITLQRLLGHATIQQTMKYVHLAPDFMTAEVARISFAMPVAGVADMGEARRQREMDGTTTVQTVTVDGSEDAIGVVNS